MRMGILRLKVPKPCATCDGGPIGPSLRITGFLRSKAFEIGYARTMSDPSSFAKDWEAVRTAVGSVLVGQDDVVEGVLTALFAGGHVLLEGVPGLGKTLLVRTLGAALGLDFRRIQFTPDLMPADVTGTTVVEETEQGRSLVFRRGPVFTQLLLADEINRATPKTQSAMLEAMQERSVTVGGVTHELLSLIHI